MSNTRLEIFDRSGDKNDIHSKCSYLALLILFNIILIIGHKRQSLLKESSVSADYLIEQNKIQ